MTQNNFKILAHQSEFSWMAYIYIYIYIYIYDSVRTPCKCPITSPDISLTKFNHFVKAVAMMSLKTKLNNE